MSRRSLAEAARAVDGRSTRSKQRKVGASEIGVCRRRAGYSHHGTPYSDLENVSGVAAINGTWIHKGALDTMRRQWGTLIETRVENEILRGHVDGIDLPNEWRLKAGLEPIDDAPDVVEVDDLKTKRDGRLVAYVRNVGPKRSELFQAHLYAGMLRRGEVSTIKRFETLAALGPLPVELIRLRYWSRAGEQDDAAQEYPYEQPFDPDIEAEALEWVKQVAGSGKPEDLPRDQDGPGLSIVCDNCFAYETEVITKAGVKRLGDLAGQTAVVLDGNGAWVTATAREYGVQTLRKLTLRRASETKVIYATGDHGWFFMNGSRRERTTTDDLRPGQRLASMKAKAPAASGPNRISPSAVGVQHGFVYGDGTIVRQGGPSRALFCGEKDTAMLSWFPGHEVHETQAGTRWVGNLPRYFKAAPALYEAPGYLYGFLAGYFAADGHVSEAGQCTISSASRESLLLVRDIATRLGIGTASVISKSRVGYGRSESRLYTITLDGFSLTEAFFLIPTHAARWKAAGRDDRKKRAPRTWEVVSVEETDRVEPVYCFDVPTTRSFVLVDNILTSNCPFVTECWGQAGDRAPQSILIVDDADLAQRLAEYDQYRAIERDAKAKKDLARQVLDATDPAIYTDGVDLAFKLHWSGGKTGDPKPDVDAMVALFEDAGLTVPYLEPRASARTIQLTRWEVPEIPCGKPAGDPPYWWPAEPDNQARVWCQDRPRGGWTGYDHDPAQHDLPEDQWTTPYGLLPNSVELTAGQFSKLHPEYVDPRPPCVLKKAHSGDCWPEGTIHQLDVKGASSA